MRTWLRDQFWLSETDLNLPEDREQALLEWVFKLSRPRSADEKARSTRNTVNKMSSERASVPSPTATPTTARRPIDGRCQYR